MLVDADIISLSNGVMAAGPQFEALRMAILEANGVAKEGVELYNNGWFVLPVNRGRKLVLTAEVYVEELRSIGRSAAGRKDDAILLPRFLRIYLLHGERNILYLLGNEQHLFHCAYVYTKRIL